MIDVSKYEKVGEYRNGKMTWISQKRENIVYLIMFDDDYYIGSSENIRRRFNQYIPALTKGKYEVAKIQSAFDKKKEFNVFAIEYSSKENLREREHYYINNLHPSLNTQNTKKYDIMNERIAKRIKERGMKLEDVASRLTNNRGTIGISQPSMSSLINGNPSYSRLKEIADILGITVSELVADDTEEMVVTVPKDVKTIKIKVE